MSPETLCTGFGFGVGLGEYCYVCLITGSDATFAHQSDPYRMRASSAGTANNICVLYDNKKWRCYVDPLLFLHIQNDVAHSERGSKSDLESEHSKLLN